MTGIDSVVPSHEIKPFPTREFTLTQDGPVIKAHFECPKCRIVTDIYSKNSAIEMQFCPGNQPAEVECQTLMGRSHTHPVACAGIIEEHFHSKCDVCNYIFFMGVPTWEK